MRCLNASLFNPMLVVVLAASMTASCLESSEREIEAGEPPEVETPEVEIGVDVDGEYACEDVEPSAPLFIDEERLEELCLASPESYIDLEDTEHFLELLTDEWIRCDEPNFSEFRWTDDGEGIRFQCDGTWVLIYENEDGALRSGQGIDETGEWAWCSPGGGTASRSRCLTNYGLSFHPVFTDGPRQMRTGETFELQNRFVRLADVVR